MATVKLHYWKNVPSFGVCRDSDRRVRGHRKNSYCRGWERAFRYRAFLEELPSPLDSRVVVEVESRLFVEATILSNVLVDQTASNFAVGIQHKGAPEKVAWPIVNRLAESFAAILPIGELGNQ